MRLSHALLMAAAFAAASVAQADIPPPAPEHPLPETCKPFIGVWTRDVPQVFRRSKVSQVIAIGAERGTVLWYSNEDDIAIRSDADNYDVTCTPDGAGATKLVFTAGDSLELLATPLGEGKFTTTEMSTDPSRGAPDPNFKPEAILVTWTRVVR